MEFLKIALEEIDLLIYKINYSVIYKKYNEQSNILYLRKQKILYK